MEMTERIERIKKRVVVDRYPICIEKFRITLDVREKTKNDHRSPNDEKGFLHQWTLPKKSIAAPFYRPPPRWWEPKARRARSAGFGRRTGRFIPCGPTGRFRESIPRSSTRHF